MKISKKFMNNWGSNRSLSFKEMLRRSPCSIAVLIAFIVSDCLIAKKVIQTDDRLILPWATVIVATLWVMYILIRNRSKLNI